MITVEVAPDQERIMVTSDLPMRDRDRIREIPGAKYVQKDDQWYAPLTWAICCQLRGVFNQELVIGPDLHEWASNERIARIDPAMDLRAAWDAPGDSDLYPFQRAGVQFLTWAKQGLLLDEMGTGKTPQTIRTMMNIVRNADNPFPMVVVCPNSMVYTWKKLAHQFWPGIRVGVVKGTPAVKRGVILDESNHITVVNFEAVRMFSRLAYYPGVKIKRCVVCDPTLADVPANSQSRCEWCKKELNKRIWRTVVIDEIHRMKDPKSKQTRGCWALRTPETAYAYGLTGTAIADAPDDLWPALHFIAPHEWPSRSKYLDRYCVTKLNPFGGKQQTLLNPDTRDEFFAIIDPRMRRMPKEAVLPFLPKKVYSERYVELNPKQAKAYTEMENGLISIVGDSVVVAASPLVQIGRLTQFASAYADVDDEGKVHLAEPSNKVDALVEVLDEMGEKPAVVFAESRQLIMLAAERLKKEGISFSLIVGGQNDQQREVEKDLFQNGNRRVILVTIKAGGTGITLTRSDTAIFLQRSWSNIDNMQAEDRVHRIGSEIHDHINIIDIISIGTIEEIQRVVLSGKTERLEEINRDSETMKRLVSYIQRSGTPSTTLENA